ncbi:acyl-CoA thioesterase [Nocardiopsis sp. HNM0947]|uniref:Acyl-CoA thioesterase n=1 Tax=Nocardiopsis coralli TaxID=2772213 RepID=A0ABR9P3P8_9ACTN|nr:thioesterase family protein [Nocardiopsis coralli]MBE2998453.1 acyl-CoA thioesterase [Nocardiopsis coralli]
MTQTEAGPAASETQGGTPQRHVHLQQVRYADLDPQFHVNNVRMLTYLEDARISFLHFGQGHTDQVFGAMVVARQEADYLAPLLPRTEPVRVELWVTEVRNSSFTLAYEILDENTVYLRARTVLVGFDVDQQRARRLDAAERAFLADYA